MKDTGIGIEIENQELIFQRFRQVETTDARTYGGNGLGLSISKILTEKLGGAMSVSSGIMKGSIFTFTIPFSMESENSVTKITTVSDTHSWDEKTILLVEDEVNNHAFIQEMLAVTNIKILHAWNGREAVENVKKHSEISLIIMDIKMPLMDGYEATRQIKQIRPKIPVIAQTAYALSSDKDLAIKNGCDNYISKPIDRELFMELIDCYLA